MNKKSDFYYGRKVESISIGTCDGLADKIDSRASSFLQP